MSIRSLAIGVVGLLAGAYIGQVLRNLGFIVARPAPVCDDPGRPGCGSNPRQCGTSQAIVLDPSGRLATSADCGEGPATVVVLESGRPALEANARARLMFAPAPRVEVTIIHFGSPARVEAFDVSGAAGMVAFTGPAAGVEHVVTVQGSAISRIDVTPTTPGDRVLVVGWCH
jgi:hypothetical protein